MPENFVYNAFFSNDSGSPPEFTPDRVPGRVTGGGRKEIPVILSPYRYAPGFQNDSGDDDGKEW